MSVNIGERMRALIPLLHKGVNGVELPDVEPEGQGEWSEDYAIVYRVYHCEDGEYFDESAFWEDVRQFVKKHFEDGTESVIVGNVTTTGKLGDVVARFCMGSQEIEVARNVKRPAAGKGGGDAKG